MAKLFLRLAIVALILPIISAAALAKDAPTSAEQLRSELEAAIRAKDTNAIISLFNLKGVSDDMKEMTPMTAGELAGYDLQSVKISPIANRNDLTNEVEGVRYFPNVEVVGMIDVEDVKPGNSTHMPYGTSGGKFYLPGTLQEIFKTNAPKEKMLNVLVTSSSKEAHNIIVGSYIYFAGGKEISETLTFTNNMGFSFRGDSIKSCQFSKANKDGYIQLCIREDNQKIFDSGKVKSTNTVSYEKK